MQDLTDATFDRAVASEGLPMLVDFWAPWCGPCRVLEPTLIQVAKTFEGRLLVARVNVDDSRATAEAHGIRSIPTLILFRGGRSIARKVGVASLTELTALLNDELAQAANVPSGTS